MPQAVGGDYWVPAFAGTTATDACLSPRVGRGKIYAAAFDLSGAVMAPDTLISAISAAL